MKKTLKIFAFVLVLVMAFSLLTACGRKLSGEYENLLFSIAFDGDEFTMTTVGVLSISGTYEIKEVEGEDRIVFTLGEDSKDKDTSTFKAVLGGENGVSLEEGDDYVKIAGVTFTEKK